VILSAAAIVSVRKAKKRGLRLVIEDGAMQAMDTAALVRIQRRNDLDVPEGLR